MRVTILPGDKAVYVDGNALVIEHWDDLGIDATIESVEYDSTLGRGIVQYKRPDPLVLDKAKFNDLFVQAIAHFDNRVYDLEKERVEFEARTRANDEKLRQTAESRRKTNERTSADVAALKAQLAALHETVVKLAAKAKTE